MTDPLPQPKIAAKQPAEVEIEKGKTYFFCTCGLSQKQPFCDGAHKGTGMKSSGFSALKTEKVSLCQCKRSGSQPFCDGAHKKITD